MALAGASLTMASIAVLPVLIGLAVDYAIQLQSRIQEEGPPRRAGASARGAERGAPTVALAAAATAPGFLVLVLSPVPMVRGFGLLLVAGIALALGCALTLGVAAQALAERRARPAQPPAAAAGRRRRRAVAAAWRGAGEIVAGLRRGARAGRAGRARRSRGAARSRRRARSACWRSRSRSPRSAGRSTRRRASSRTSRSSSRRTCRRCATSRLQRDQRRRRRGRRGRRGPARHRPGGRRLDDALPAARAQAARLHREEGLRQGRDLSRRSRCPDLFTTEDVAVLARADRGAARRRPAVLLPDRHHRRPAHRRRWPSACG